MPPSSTPLSPGLERSPLLRSIVSLQVLQDRQIQRLEGPGAVEIVEQVVRVYLLVTCPSGSSYVPKTNDPPPLLGWAPLGCLR